MKTSWFKTMAAACAVSLVAFGAQGAEKITIDRVSNHYPWDGKVDCVTTLSGLHTNDNYYEGLFTLSVEQGGETISKTVTNIYESVDGTYTNTFDCAALFGAGLYPNGGITVSLVRKYGGVQLWEGGPYFATKNVGAENPTDYGYYFWWGDTVGYTNILGKAAVYGGMWFSVSDGKTSITFDNTTPARSTYGKDIATLKSGGWIDANSNLVVSADAAKNHDAARAHWGSPWRMITAEEIQSLCKAVYTYKTVTSEWVTTNGVAGLKLTGTGAYAQNSIFLPAAGRGTYNKLLGADANGMYWASTPYSKNSYYAYCLDFDSSTGGGGLQYRERYLGYSIRPVRVSAE